LGGKKINKTRGKEVYKIRSVEEKVNRDLFHFHKRMKSMK